MKGNDNERKNDRAACRFVKRKNTSTFECLRPRLQRKPQPYTRKQEACERNAAAREVRNMLCDFVIDELHINELLNGDGAPNYDERGDENG